MRRREFRKGRAGNDVEINVSTGSGVGRAFGARSSIAGGERWESRFQTSLTNTSYDPIFTLLTPHQPSTTLFTRSNPSHPSKPQPLWNSGSPLRFLTSVEYKDGLLEIYGMDLGTMFQQLQFTHVINYRSLSELNLTTLLQATYRPINWKDCERKPSWPTLKHYPVICSKGPQNN